MTTIVAFLIASSTSREVRRRVEQHPFISVAPGGGDDAADGVHRGLDRRLVGPTQLVPQRQRPLRIGIDEQDWLACLDLRSEMCGQGTLARAAFTRCKNNDVHTLALQIDPRLRK